MDSGTSLWMKGHHYSLQHTFWEVPIEANAVWDHEVIEGLPGIEVVADDFVAVGSEETHEQATPDHDEHLKAFLQHCVEKYLKLNDTKFKLIGHVATANGLCVDPHKVQAIMEMPQPDDVAAIQCLLGLAQYLSKFLPHLSA